MNIDRKTPIRKAVDTSHEGDRPEVEGHGFLEPQTDDRVFGQESATPTTDTEVEGHGFLEPPTDGYIRGQESAKPDDAPEDDGGPVEGIPRF
jgi:hypothetical protein